MLKNVDFQKKMAYAKSINVLDIIEQFIEVHKVSDDKYEALCPFHHDTSMGSFVISPSKNIFKCFACNETGDGIEFVRKYKNLSFIDAVEYICSQNKNKDKNYKGSVKYIPKQEDEKILLADDKLDTVYRIFLDMCKLSKNHLDMLKNERHLSDKEISKRMFRTMTNNRIIPSFIKALKEKSDISLDELQCVPGFYFEDNELKIASNRGIIIPIFNLHNQIIRLQIRRDKVTENRSRYVWFSSSFIKTGIGSGNALDINMDSFYKLSNLFITEGVFKSLSIGKYLKCPCISLQGVNAIKGLDEFLIEYNKAYPIKSIVIAFDSDIQSNKAVKKAQKNLIKMIQEVCSVNIFQAQWQEEDGKGIDDLFNNKTGKINFTKIS